MKAVASGLTALWYIRQARISDAGHGAGQLRSAPLPDLDSLARDSTTLKKLGLGHLLNPVNPCTILMSAGTSRTSSRLIRQQAWNGPDGSDVTCLETKYPDLLALGPEACLVTLARTWNVASLAMLIDEFCGKFALLPSRDSFVQVAPIWTLAQINNFIELCSGCRGIKRLRTALAIAGTGAESPLEAQIRTWLCAPVHLGGFGCGNPQGNPTFKLGRTDGLDGEPRETSCRLDLYWPKARLGVECDGSQHDEQDRYEADRIRNARLTRLGIREIRFSAMSLDRFDDALEIGSLIRQGLGLSEKGPDKQRALALWREITSSEWEHVPMERVD